ncbi:hypothetical protein Dimus_016609, partial [Dionaea muscipula]
AVLLERPCVISANVGHAWDLPPYTYGEAYVKFMGSRNFSPDDRPPVRFMDIEELAYVVMRANAPSNLLPISYWELSKIQSEAKVAVFPSLLCRHEL